MRILVVGSNGQLGRDMVAACAAGGHRAEGLDVPDIDITNPACDSVVGDALPDIVVNCAGYTAVDACESNRDAAFRVNADGVANLARAAGGLGIPLVHIGTDYVFDGAASEPYVETDTPNPISVYGESKLAGERMLAAVLEQHYIFRISWLYGVHGKNFVKTMRRLARQKQDDGTSLRVVNDQTGTPTFSMDVCRQILAVIPTGRFGLYHCSNEGSCTWYEFASHILRASGIDAAVEPCATRDYPLPALRPAYSVMENRRLKDEGMHIMSDWRDAFAAFLAQEAAGSGG
ncbi:MAG: dTDP-4-dehydrorhamnose reductase [Chitinivibrionales bacterium]|nr:dTDP-4-dehydrorhamnose reductase [Chitinivibrionales bacterium]MBD3394466.1 dTDP-4-dehydrorhamnose reductase [Chitinivibrionales bacterium]